MAEVVADAPQPIAEENPSISESVETVAIQEEETNGASKRGREEEEEKSKDEILKKPKVDDESKEEAEAEVKPVSAKLGPKEFESGEGMFNYFIKFLHYWPPNIDINKYPISIKKIQIVLQILDGELFKSWRTLCNVVSHSA